MRIPLVSNWLDKRNREHNEVVLNSVFKTMNMLDSVSNVGSGALRWKDIFPDSHASERLSRHTDMALSAIYCALNLYIGVVNGLPRAMRRIDPETQQTTGYVKTTAHPASRIWSHYPNAEWNADDLMKQILFDVLYYDGNFYALKEFDSQGRTFRLHYIHPSRIPAGNISRAKGGEVLLRKDGQRFATQGEIIYKVMTGVDTEDANPQSMNLSQEMICHIKGSVPDSSNFRSQGIFEHNTNSSQLYAASETMARKFYSSGYQNQMFLSTDKKLAPNVRKELADAVNNKNQGVSIEDLIQTKILEHNLKPVHVGLPMNAIQFIETKAFSIEDVARWFYLPPGLLHSIMGTGQGPEDYDRQMYVWIQNGLTPLMNNITSQFRFQVLPRETQMLYKFDFSRIHLYRTVINEFSQAIRNFFEIGIINREIAAELLGVYLDPSDTTNSQRYVPANIITIEHSLALQEKAEKSIEQMDQTMEQTAQTMEQSALSHERLMSSPVPDPNASPQPPPNQLPKKEDTVPNPAEGKPPSEENSDKKIRAASNLGDITSFDVEELASTSVRNIIKGLDDYRNKVIEQKKKSRPTDFEDAIEEFKPKFSNMVEEQLGPWRTAMELLNLPTPEALSADWEKLTGEINEDVSDE